MNMKRLSQVGLTLVLLSSAFAENVTININKFNAGELSPLMNARFDMSKYRSGAKTLENMLVRTQGPVMRRPGTKYIASVKDANDPTRLFPFEYSTEDTYIIEAGDQYFRFFRDGAVIGAPYEIVSPYDSNDIFEVQYVQNAQVMRMTHPDYPPYKLTRTGHAAWTITEIDFSSGPFLDENEDTTLTITPSARVGSITLTASAALFDVSDHVGALWQISQITDANSATGRMDEVGDLVGDITVEVGREYTWVTSGHWSGTIILQRSEDEGVSFTTVGPPAAYNFNGNIQYTGIETEADSIYRLRMTVYNAGDDNVTFPTLTALSFIRRAAVEITAVASTTSATATVIDTLDSTDATYRWAEGAWSTFRGFPRTVVHHEQRTIYAGSTSYPQTVWGSIIASQDSDFDDFGTDDPLSDDDAWTYILPGMNPIQWLRSQELLMIGTTSSIGLLGQPDKPITPTFPPIYRTQAQNGSAYIQAVNAVDVVLFVERGGQKIREALYTFASDRYIAPDLTILSEHITGDGILEIAFQNRPDPVLWCIREDGQLLSFTYQRKNDVLAWTRNDTGTTDSFDSAAVIPGATTEDELWFVVDRTVDSNSVKYVEQLQPYDWGSDQNDAWFVDSGNTDGNDLAHLEGETVVVYADGRPLSDSYTVSGGAISVSGYTDYVIGLPYTSVYESMPMVGLTRSTNKPTVAQKARTRSLQVDVQETLGFHVGSDVDHLSDVRFSTDSFATTLDVYTGLKPPYNHMPFMHGWSREPVVYIEESSPIPLTIRNIQVKMEVVDD